MKFEGQAMFEKYVSALQQVVERHDILRTAFIWEGLNEPAQVVLRHVPSILTEFKLIDSNKSVLGNFIDRFNSHNYRLDLKQPPLLRLIAAPTSDGSWIAIQLMHHIVGDNVTAERLYAEVQTMIDGRSSQLTRTKPTPFRNVVAQVRLSANQANYKEFFSQMLADVDTPTFPFGLNNIYQDRIKVDETYMKLPQELNKQLKAYTRRFHVSLASLFHLAWAQVLARTSGTDKVVFGTVLLGRFQSTDMSDSAMGLLINTLPIRIDIDKTTIENAVHQTHTRLADLLMHEYATLALAQHCSGLLKGLPLFSALLNYRHNLQIAHATHPGITILHTETQTNYPLSLSADDDESMLSLSVQVLSSISAKRICGYMQQTLVSLVNALANTPQQPTRTLTVIPDEEREMLLKQFNDTDVTYSAPCCLHELFETQVVRDGEGIAVECEGKTMTYAALNNQANKLAHYLIAQGVKPDDRIALCLKRSIKMLVAILGILKSGGAYVPLDPLYSSQRLTRILNDSDPMYLLVDNTGQKAIGDIGVQIWNLEEALPAYLSTDNPDPIQLGLTPTHLAYVMYTSGSTGAPKGVMVEHRQVINLLNAMDRTCNFTGKDIWCLFISISFDISVSEIGGAWYNGGKLVIIPQDIIRSPTEFYQLICEQGVTVLHQTPAALKAFQTAESESIQTHSLRCIIFGGESTEPISLRRWYISKNDVNLRMVQIYGPTEATIFTTSWMYDDTIPEDAPLPIGRPLSNIRIYLLDAFGELVPLGAEGELYIGGAGVARGYFNRPELTAERFMSDPFSDDPMARIYRTGDRARYLPDGILVFLGRIDQQVKIRGFRIELGEIEARLIEHSLVHEAVVHPWIDSTTSDVQLIAYVVADPDSSLTQNLRSYLASLLPDYMVPAAYVCLSSLPLMPNGKLDRRALLAPDESAFSRQSYEAPQGEIEKNLAEIWGKIFGIDSISRHDNFFALGGHSLLIVRMLSQLQQYGLCISVREVFDTPTLASLAKSLHRHRSIIIPPNLITADCTMITPEMLPLIDLSQAEIDVIVAQVPGGVTNIQDIYGLAPLQNGILFHHMMAECGDPYLLISRMKFGNRDILQKYASALQQVVERHDILRTVFIWEELNQPAQVVLRHVPSILTEIISSDFDEPVLEQLSNNFNPRQYKLDLKQAPLLRLIAALTCDGNWIALQLMHHIIGDNVTMQRLSAEAQTIMKGQNDELVTPTPFRNAIAQIRQSVSQVDHTKFFTEMLADVDTPTLPFGRKDIHQEGIEVDEAHLKLPTELNNQLRTHASHFRVTLTSLCHLAWAQILAHSSGTETVVFGTVLFGRLQSGEWSESAIGLLINTLPLRLDIDETTVENAVRHTHTRLSDLLMHEHATLALAQRCSGVPKGIPLFSALRLLFIFLA